MLPRSMLPRHQIVVGVASKSTLHNICCMSTLYNLCNSRCCHAGDFRGDWMVTTGDAPLTCVLQSTHVQQVCGEATVEISWLRQRRSHGYTGDQLALDNITNVNRRYHAYRNYIELVYLRLGPRNRRVIPACVVSYIRSKWPSPDHTYVGYKDAPSDEDEDELEQLLTSEDL